MTNESRHMSDCEFYDHCAIMAMRSLITKTPRCDSQGMGSDAVDQMRHDIAESANDYAAAMVVKRRQRLTGEEPTDDQ